MKAWALTHKKSGDKLDNKICAFNNEGTMAIYFTRKAARKDKFNLEKVVKINIEIVEN